MVHPRRHGLAQHGDAGRTEHGALAWLSSAINPDSVHLAAALIFAYGVLRMVEAWGLWRVKAVDAERTHGWREDRASVARRLATGTRAPQAPISFQ